MKTFLYPDKKDWKLLLQRPIFDTVSLQEKVSTVLNDVKQHGDAAIKKYTAQFDVVELDDFVVSQDEIEEAVASL
ncbi:MAG: histidinol dehydrogenase, partial [Chitinophagaceae bacterium]|nr:histidinol dehydrogenase [Chitinophagaceae bacterium]